MMFVFDIETVPSPDWDPPADQPDAFAPLHAHRIIVAGFALLSDEYELLEVDAYTGSGTGGRDADERAIVAGLSSRLDKLARAKDGGSLTIVSYNGRTFDMPVIVLRALAHLVRLPWYFGVRGMRYRYDEAGHLDLADAVSDYGAGRMTSLDNLARICGLPGKVGVHGGDVARLYRAGELQKIADYCVADCAHTALLLLRWKMIKGELTAQGYRDREQALRAAFANDPRLTELFAVPAIPAASNA